MTHLPRAILLILTNCIIRVSGNIVQILNFDVKSFSPPSYRQFVYCAENGNSLKRFSPTFDKSKSYYLTRTYGIYFSSQYSPGVREFEIVNSFSSLVFIKKSKTQKEVSCEFLVFFLTQN